MSEWSFNGHSYHKQLYKDLKLICNIYKHVKLCMSFISKVIFTFSDVLHMIPARINIAYAPEGIHSSIEIPHCFIQIHYNWKLLLTKYRGTLQS